MNLEIEEGSVCLERMRDSWLWSISGEGGEGCGE